MKNKMLSRQYTQSTERTVTRKRPASVVKTSSPERKAARRMTISPQLTRTPPRPTQKDHRLSILPNKESNTHDFLQRKRTVPLTLAKRTKSSEDPDKRPRIADRAPKAADRTQNRLLDVYGIPYSQKSKTQEMDIPKRALELLTKPKVSVPYNELHQRIRVCVRKRPLNRKELSSKDTDIASIVGSRTVELHAERIRIDLARFTETHTFTFDEAFDSNVKNTEVYMRTAQPLIEYIFAGGNGTCFAYGQTGSGKTHTMLDSHDGLYVLAAQEIFRMLSQSRYSHLSANVGFYEIYQNQLYDLLNNRNKLIARDNGNNHVVIVGLQEIPIINQEGLLSVFERGNQERTTGKTGVNNKSSRSHAVLQITLKPVDNPSFVHGKLSFIDLAGSERGADRGDANNKTRLEGAEINKSLLALKECIRALDQDKKHAPFRGSKLTQVLRDCFVGDARTCMIATISPNSPNSEHTLNTLRYADRVKQLRGESDPRLVGDPSRSENKVESPIEVDTELEETQDEVRSLASTSIINDDEQTENLLDVDFPTVVTSAFNTPTNDRYLRAEDYEVQPESLHLDMLSNTVELYESKFTERQEEISEERRKERRIESEKNSKKMDVNRINQFMRLHRRQIKDLEDCLKEEKKLLTKLSLLTDTSKEEYSQPDEEENTKREYENYLNDLDEILTHNVHCMEIVQEKIKDELGD
ncbi:unnamed protein product [Rhizopus stolonifer]